jgi:hypothetical protein
VGWKWFSIVLGVDLGFDASTAGDVAAMVVGAVEIGARGDIAAVLETVDVLGT